MGVVSVTNGTVGTEVDTSGRTRQHVFGQRIKRGRAVIPLDVTVHRRHKWGGWAGGWDEKGGREG